MALRTLQYVVPDGRDAGKTFIINEMPSDQGEWWALRALLAIGKNGIDLPEGFEEGGMAMLAEVGFKALFKCLPDDVKPLLDELWNSCVKIIPDASKPHVQRAVIAQDIEDVSTRLKIRWEALKLHVDFSKAASPSTSEVSAAPQ